MKKTLIPLLFCFLFISFGETKEQKTNNMDDFEKLLNTTFPFVEDLLKKYGEFFPLASAIDKNGKVVTVGTYDGNEHPVSEKVIADLKAALQNGAKKGEYNASTIFYDAKVIDPNTNEKTDVVIVFAESKNDTTAYKFFYSYQLKDNVLTFGNSWKTTTEKEIFID